MVMQLEKVVPFGRSLDEYRQMFNLSEQDLQKSILGAGDGPASFNAEGTAQGYHITSIDPLYCFTAEQIRSRFNQVVDNIIEQVHNTPGDWVWTYHRSPADLRANRERALNLFCADYEQGKREQRYHIGELPTLSYGDRQFQLGLCSHLLLLYSDHLDLSFHLASISELLRVCHEVRIFPLLTLMSEPSPYLTTILDTFTKQGYRCAIESVPYELQRGGNQMLKICR